MIYLKIKPWIWGSLIMTSLGGAPLIERVIDHADGENLVYLSVEAGEEDVPYVLEEFIPSELSAYDVSHGGNVDPFSQSIKWGPFFQAGAVELRYALAGRAGDFQIQGQFAHGDTLMFSSLTEIAIEAGPLWRPSTVFSPDGWSRNEWFGDFLWPLEVDNWLFHHTHSYLYYHGHSGQEAVFLWDYRLGWLFTGSGYYPWFYELRRPGWLLYVIDSHDPRWFWSPDESSWVTEDR